MSKFVYNAKRHPSKVVLLHDEAHLREHLIVNDEYNVAFPDSESEELFLIGVKIKGFQRKYWGKFVDGIVVGVNRDNTETIFGRIKINGKELKMTIEPWMISRPVTPETDPESFV